MNDSTLKYYIYNDEVYETSQDDGFKKTQSLSVYEVIRVKDGVILFKEEHLDRMAKSVEMLGYEMQKTKQEIMDEMKKLVEINNAKDHNIKLVCSNFDKDKQNFITYITSGSYNIEDVPKDGAKTIIFKAERDNPNIKTINAQQREMINEELEKNNAFEALLEDEEGFITEGSRSNMLFIKNEKIYTAPAKNVLIGITRSKIMDICRELKIEIVEENIHSSEIKSLDGAFLSTTPVGVLPIVSIDDIKLDSKNQDIIKKVIEGYSKLVEEYIKKTKIH